MEISNLFGLPAHPLFVHIPVVLVPLAAVGALLMVVAPRWRRPLAVPVAAMTALSLVVVQLAIGSGEQLQERVAPSPLIAHHSQLAEQSRPLVALFFLASAVALVVVYRRPRHRVGDGPGTPALGQGRSRLLAGLCVLSLVLGVVATVGIVRAGHSGARAAWNVVPTQSDRGDDG